MTTTHSRGRRAWRQRQLHTHEAGEREDKDNYTLTRQASVKTKTTTHSRGRRAWRQRQLHTHEAGEREDKDNYTLTRQASVKTKTTTHSRGRRAWRQRQLHTHEAGEREDKDNYTLTRQASVKIKSGRAPMKSRYLQPSVGITKMEMKTMKHAPVAQNSCKYHEDGYQTTKPFKWSWGNARWTRIQPWNLQWLT